MKINKSKIAAAIVLAGLSFGTAQTASAAILADGTYNILINQTPWSLPYPDIDIIAITPGSNGPAGSWNSAFAFGGDRPSTSSQGMYDAAGPTTVKGRTTGVLDGVAGKIGITVTGGTFTVSSFQVDPIFRTAGGTFFQYANSTALMSGTIDQTTGAMTLDPTGRLGAVSGFPTMVDEPWNVDNYTSPTNTAWSIFTTGVANSVNTGTNVPATVTGHALVASGTGANGVLVSGGRCGTAWGGFAGCGYFETWNISVVAASPVPVPAAAWLLGSGLIGLIGLGRRSR